MTLSVLILAVDCRALAVWVAACTQHSTIRCLADKAVVRGAMTPWHLLGRDTILSVRAVHRGTIEEVPDFLAEEASEASVVLEEDRRILSVDMATVISCNLVRYIASVPKST
jgi:hypothetical protein